MVRKPMYFDHSATTPVDPEVLEKMIPYFSADFGNPSSVHRYGQRAEAALSHARAEIAEVLGCQPQEIVFTANGTESDNIALRGAALYARQARGATHILISPTEHEAVHKTAHDLQSTLGFEIEMLPVDRYGSVAPEDVQSRLRDTTAVVSVMYANNEVGTVNPIPDLASIIRERGIPFHADAVQAATYLDLDVNRLSVDLLALSAHKFYGPKGVGVLYVRGGTPLHPLLTGGNQEFGLRPGTENIPLAVGCAHALSLARADRQTESARVTALRDRIIETVLTRVPGSTLTGHPNERLPNHASFVFEAVDGNQLLAALDLEGFACSSGSACKTGDPEPSRVLEALGIHGSLAMSSLRVTIGRGTDTCHVDMFLDRLPKLIARLRSVPEAV